MPITPSHTLLTRPVFLAIMLGALTALGPFTMDLYLPAFPEVQEDLAAPAAAVQATLTATAVGMGAGQLVVGPISDAIGRRIPLIIATLLHVASSMLIALSPGIEIVAVARFGQGFGAAGGAIVAAAMVRDLFGGKKLVKMAAHIALIAGFAPIIAPVIGSQLLTIMPWRGVFWILATYGLAILLAACGLIPETRVCNARGVSLRLSARTVALLVRDRMYISTVVISAIVFAIIITYLSTSSFIYQTGFGISVQEFGVIFAVTSCGVVAATQFAAWLMRRVRPAVLLAYAMPTVVLVGASFILIDIAELGVAWMVVVSFLVVAFQGFCNPCMQVLILADHEEESGTAVALSGFVNSILGGGVSLLPALLGGIGPASLGIIVAVAGIIGIMVVLFGLRPASTAELASH